MKRFAPAKINLSLEVLGKRPDGFHDLRSLFCPISLVDELDFERATCFEFSCSDPSIPRDERNLVVKAAKWFGGGVLPKVRVHLEKRIPHSAGLGGGSSDAATTLLALNELASEPKSFGELSEIAASLGSDVPFFLHESPAWCEGRGERVAPARLENTFVVLLFKPGFGVPTPWAYKNLAASRELPSIPYARQQTVAGSLVNDLERPVFEKYVLLGLVKKWLLDQPETLGALMSGSGATMFAIASKHADATALRERLLMEVGADNWTWVGSVMPFPLTDLRQGKSRSFSLENRTK
ncbi:MAG TPA: 4-(cytidine 5'-diphospho)-2-C-methyl-D-erythritol kinase [Chthoniobacterales bacterium]